MVPVEEVQYEPVNSFYRNTYRLYYFWPLINSCEKLPLDPILKAHVSDFFIVYWGQLTVLDYFSDTS